MRVILKAALIIPYLTAWAEPGGTYTLTGQEKGIEEIVKADMASLIGAFILFVLTIGAVRGFALYLGVATVIDMVVSYVFMRPAVVLLARKFAADKPERLGIVPQRKSADADGEVEVVK